MAKENGKKKARFTCPNRIFTFSFRCSFVTLVTRAQNIRKFNLCGSQYADSFTLLFLSLSLQFAGLFVLDFCLFSFVVDFDFYGCQRALKVAKRVTLHSIPLRLWRVFNSPVNHLQSRVANWNSAWGGDKKGKEAGLLWSAVLMALKGWKGTE